MLIDTVPITNLLLNALTANLRTKILSSCEQIELEFGVTLCNANEPYKHVYFPLKGFISQIAVADDHASLEVGLIGNEGMLGASLALGVNIAPLQAVVQGAGKVLRIPSEVFLNALSSSTSLSLLLHQYLYVVMQQLTQTTVCVHFGYRKVRYKGLVKNAQAVFTKCALVNLFIAKRHLMAF